MRPFTLLCASALIAGLAACNEPDPASRQEEGLYGASSGPNPNLDDMRRQDEGGDSAAPADPASPAEATYPSQAGSAPPPPTDAGRRSATTGATDD